MSTLIALNMILEKNAIEEGANFFGVGDLSRAKAAVHDQGGTLVSKYEKSVSIGITLPKTVVDALPRRSEREAALNYLKLYDITNARLDKITTELSRLLEKEGYEALPVPASERYDNERICAIFSNKLAANMAGLGWIGKSCLLINPEAGPRVRWATVLTNAPLEVTGTPMEVQCGDCQECVEICPVNAFTGEPFREDEPREARYDARKCEEYLFCSGEEDEPFVCGLCVYVCPHGRK